MQTKLWPNSKLSLFQKSLMATENKEQRTKNLILDAYYSFIIIWTKDTRTNKTMDKFRIEFFIFQKKVWWPETTESKEQRIWYLMLTIHSLLSEPKALGQTSTKNKEQWAWYLMVFICWLSLNTQTEWLYTKYKRVYSVCTTGYRWCTAGVQGM